jgi:hypothetical protein
MEFLDGRHRVAVVTVAMPFDWSRVCGPDLVPGVAGSTGTLLLVMLDVTLRASGDSWRWCKGNLCRVAGHAVD